MPLFKSLWELMDKNGAHIDASKVDNIFTVSNATPGVIATKLATFSGYLSANGEWWGWLALILTYLIFSIPSIVIVWWAYKAVAKSETSKYLKNMMKLLRPVIIGILLALSVQLFLGTAFPQIIFNSSKGYMEIDDSTSRTAFFSGWRLYALISYTIVVIPESFILYRRNINLFTLIASHMVIGLILFEPWL